MVPRESFVAQGLVVHIEGYERVEFEGEWRSVVAGPILDVPLSNENDAATPLMVDDPLTGSRERDRTTRRGNENSYTTAVAS